jgi:hypothetical protein
MALRVFRSSLLNWLSSLFGEFISTVSVNLDNHRDQRIARAVA